MRYTVLRERSLASLGMTIQDINIDERVTAVSAIHKEHRGRPLGRGMTRMDKAPQYWLMKTEPSVYSIDDLARDGRTPWEGVRNYQARNFMRDRMRPDDRVLIYHSNVTPPGVVGLARVCSAAYPDPTALDPASNYYDSRSRAEKPVWFLVDVCFEEKFSRLVSLAAGSG